MGNALRTVDDIDPRLIYQGEWQELGAGQDYRTTLHRTASAGSSIRFTFNGTFIAVYGTVDGFGGISSFALDGGEAVSFMQPSIPSCCLQFYASPHQLSYGEHTLNITAMEDGRPFQLNYLEYDAHPSDAGRWANSSQDGSPPQSAGFAQELGEIAHVSLDATLSDSAVAGLTCATVVFAFGSLLAALLWFNSRHPKPENGEMGIIGTGGPISPKNHLVPTSAHSSGSSFPRSQGVQSSAVFSSVVMLSFGGTITISEGEDIREEIGSIHSTS